jgi:hypothetical protein
MTGQQKVAVWTTATLSVAIVIGGFLFIIRHRPPGKPLILSGVVLVRDSDPGKQLPIADAEIIATTPLTTMNTTSDPSGFFHLTLPPQKGNSHTAVLKFVHPGYLPYEIAAASGDQIYVTYLASKLPKVVKPASRNEAVLSNVRVRYSEKAELVTNIGSLVKTFEVVNTGNVPCNKQQQLCSPDGKWKANIGSFTEEGQGQEFRHARLSCIAGPCPFTRVEPQTLLADGHTLKIAIRNWSDTTTFLLEAEVSQTMLSDEVRQTYPAKFGSSMSFTLPATAEGPSVEADLNGHDIVFPLGPDLIVSWGVCSVKVAPDRTKLYRCDLKPGFRFQ